LSAGWAAQYVAAMQIVKYCQHSLLSPPTFGSVEGMHGFNRTTSE
jgi:hypothetical protein